MPPLTPAGAFARPAARQRASASSKAAPRKKPAPVSPKPRTNAAHKPVPARRKTRRKLDAAPKRSPPPTRRVTPWGVITVRAGRPLA